MAVTAGKADIVDAVAEKTGMTKKDALGAVDAVVDSIVDALQRGERVQLTGFGTFEIRQRRERMGKNPQSGEQIVIAACKVPAFKAGKALKDAVK